MTIDSTITILNRAAELIESNGWYPANKTWPSHCALTAIREASDAVIGDRRTLYADARRTFDQFLGADYIVEWNDQQPDGLTVIQALRDCVYKLSLDNFGNDDD